MPLDLETVAFAAGMSADIQVATVCNERDFRR